MALTGCGTITEPYLPTTSVVTLPGEDLAGPCDYTLRLVTGPPPAPQAPPTSVVQAGVLVIFERSDSANLFKDPTVIAMAAQLHLATVFAHECDAESFPDFQFDATKGPSRALFQALSQFAASTGHPELTKANLVLAGFSAAGYLSLSIANQYPARVLGAVLYAPASAYADLDDVTVSAGAAKIPMLILAGGADVSAGTHRPLNLFNRGWTLGAPWAFAVQQNVGHCCTDSTAPVMNPWVQGLVQGYTTTSPSGQLALRTPVSASAPLAPTVEFVCGLDDSFDVFGWQDCVFRGAEILPSTASGLQPAWLPDGATAGAWLAWVTNAQ